MVKIAYFAACSKFLYSGQYRREVLFKKPVRKLFKIERNSPAKMQLPSKDQIAKVKAMVDCTEARLRGGSLIDDYKSVVEGTKTAAETGLKAWDTGLTVVQSANAVGEGMLGANALAESIAEWRKGHYFCCICSGVSCACFWTAAIGGIVPGGSGVWAAATKAGSVTKSVTYTCRKITGGF